MIRNIVRTSRWLARRRINTFTPVLQCQYSCQKRLNTFYNTLSIRQLSASPSDTSQADHVEPAVFEEICSETLESLCDYFEEIVEQDSKFKGADITYSDGVLTVALGSTYGTYVINRQSPNKQIWLSSPTSGPKRYDLILKDGGYWIYKHDGVSLHKLLQDELSKIVKNKVDFTTCAHSVL